MSCYKDHWFIIRLTLYHIYLHVELHSHINKSHLPEHKNSGRFSLESLCLTSGLGSIWFRLESASFTDGMSKCHSLIRSESFRACVLWSRVILAYCNFNYLPSRTIPNHSSCLSTHNTSSYHACTLAYKQIPTHFNN